MKRTLTLAAIAMLTMALGACHASAFKLENGYFSVSGKDGIVNSMCFDPAGKSQYGRNHILGFAVGAPVPDPNAVAVVDPSGSRLILKGAKFANPTTIVQDKADFPAELKPGGTLGQSFAIKSGFLQSVQIALPTWMKKGSAVTMTLYRLDGKRRTKVVSKRATDLKDGAWVELKFADQPAGKYLVEISDPKGTVGWWSLAKNAIAGDAYLNGKPVAKCDRELRCYGYEVGSGDFAITLDGNKFHSEFTPAPGQGQVKLEHKLKIPWIKAGYDTTSEKIIFHHFLTSDGLYMPVHQFKRRPFSSVHGATVLMSGRFGTDIKFIDAPIRLDMADAAMTMTFPGAKRDFEVLPHVEKLPDSFPEFFSSDTKTDTVLNEFLLSHNFNFGVGTNSDWKDWHTAQLAWTANFQNEWQRLQFLGTVMSPDGYVHCWGSDPGWPFPFKDDNKDGQNDLDTRHFTSNPCYLIGAWREYCWRPESDYLAKLMPRMRWVMEFMLKQQDGDKGILIAKAPGHEGRDGDIGSNYWDITPFGWKDAFTNTEYYPSLEAMAQLEEAVLRDPVAKAAIPADALPAREPSYYRELAKVVRKSYNASFWMDDKGRYSGCVDKDGITHDYGFTFVNLPAMANGLADPDQVKRIYNWMETGITSSGKADTYSRWIIAPRACTIHNPNRSEKQTPIPSWWCGAWRGTSYEEQCQDGGAILYTSYHDIIARARFLGADNAWKRLTEILDRYSKPDHLSGGSPLWCGTTTQGGPGGTAGTLGLEGEFPESGLVPVSFLYAFLGVDADLDGLKIRPNLPSSLSYAGVRNLRYRDLMYDIRVTNSSVELTCTTKDHERTIRKDLNPGEVFRYAGE